MKSKGSPALPFADTVGNSFELMKKMWGMAGLPVVPDAGNLASMAMRLPQQLPTMVAPTFDVEELDRRIADLRAVEQWLELNAGMLRTAIQTLEVQRATISTLKGISGAVFTPLARPAARPENAPVMAPPAIQQQPPPARKSARKRRKSEPQHAPSVAEAPLNPTAWWNTLQDQFNRIAESAAASAGQAAAKKQVGSRKSSRGKKT